MTESGRGAPGSGGVYRTNLVERAVAAVRRDPVLGDGGGRVVVAVSGGPDSSALLHALAQARAGLRLELLAARLSHGWRDDAAEDAAAAALCAELGVELVRGSATGLPPGEAPAREARHAFLETLAAERGAGTVALGHTLDDQAETVLLHLIRGAGLEGLAAMAPREGLRFRPLLEVPRADVEAYCAERGLDPVADPTNTDLRFTRNRVRRRLLPELAAFNPGIREALSRLAAAAREEHQAVAAWADAALSAASPAPEGQSSRAGSPPGATVLPRALLRAVPDAVAVEILRRRWAEVAGGPPPAGRDRLRQALRLVRGTRREGRWHLGEGVVLALSEGRFELLPGPVSTAL